MKMRPCGRIFSADGNNVALRDLGAVVGECKTFSLAADRATGPATADFKLPFPKARELGEC
jgi:hypothetical protein